MRRHLEQTSERARLTVSLRTRLAVMADGLTSQQDPSPDHLFTILEEMTMLDPTVHSTTALLVYDDLVAAQRYLVDVLGLTAGSVHADDTGTVVHAEVHAGDHTLWLHPAGADYVSPRTAGAVTGMTVVAVADADAHHDRTPAAGAEIVEAPTDQDYGVREYGVRDLEGHLWFFHSPLE